MADHRFPKREKLARRVLWDAVFRQGNTHREFPLRLHWLESEFPEGIRAQAGFAVPKRTVRKAVDRNRIRRLIREAYRLEKVAFFNNTAGRYAFVFLYIGKEAPEYEQVKRAVRSLLQKIRTDEAAVTR